MEDLKTRAQVLTEALPYIREFHGATVVVKYGGNAMIDDELKRAVMSDLVLLQYIGIRPILVHGGGPEISGMLKRLGKESQFVGGLRVTDAETVEVAEMVLVGKIGKEIVNLIHLEGGRAVSVSGKDAQLMTAVKRLGDDGHDIGFVGDIVAVDPLLLRTLGNAGMIPVVSSIAAGADGTTYNVNADHVAGHVAAAVQARKLIVLTDVRGVYRDIKDETSLHSTLTLTDVQSMIDGRLIAAGMIPKLESCAIALAGGVERAHIIDGRIAHAVLMELFTDEGIGTMIWNDQCGSAGKPVADAAGQGRERGTRSDIR